jgi:hypothetical protein
VIKTFEKHFNGRKYQLIRFGLATGINEAVAGGKALKDAGYEFDVAHTSALQRAQVDRSPRPLIAGTFVVCTGSQLYSVPSLLTLPSVF